MTTENGHVAMQRDRAGGPHQKLYVALDYQFERGQSRRDNERNANTWHERVRGRLRSEQPSPRRSATASPFRRRTKATRKKKERKKRGALTSETREQRESGRKRASIHHQKILRKNAAKRPHKFNESHYY